MARKRSQADALSFIDRGAEPPRPQPVESSPRSSRKTVSFTVDPALWRELQMIAVREGTTRSAIIHGLLVRYLEGDRAASPEGR